MRSHNILFSFQLFFRSRIQDEQGYVLYVRKNALQVLIPKYGLEGTIFLAPPKGEKATVNFVYNEEVKILKCLILVAGKVIRIERFVQSSSGDFNTPRIFKPCA